MLYFSLVRQKRKEHFQFLLLLGALALFLMVNVDLLFEMYLSRLLINTNWNPEIMLLLSLRLCSIYASLYLLYIVESLTEILPKRSFCLNFIVIVPFDKKFESELRILTRI